MITRLVDVEPSADLRRESFKYGDAVVAEYTALHSCMLEVWRWREHAFPPQLSINPVAAGSNQQLSSAAALQSRPNLLDFHFGGGHVCYLLCV